MYEHLISNLQSEKIAPQEDSMDQKKHSTKTASGLEGASKTRGGASPPEFLTLPQALMLSSSNGFLIHAVFLRAKSGNHQNLACKILVLSSRTVDGHACEPQIFAYAFLLQKLPGKFA